MNIRTICNQKFDDLLVAKSSRKMYRSPSTIYIRFIHIRASSQVLFNRFDVPISGSFPN